MLSIVEFAGDYNPPLNPDHHLGSQSNTIMDDIYEELNLISPDPHVFSVKLKDLQ
jgi:hypothetical protein